MSWPSTPDVAKAEPDVRLQRALLDWLARLLPLKIWFNPAWALVAILPLSGLFPAFGRIAAWRLVAAFALHLVNSAVAYGFQQSYRRGTVPLAGWAWRFALLQALVGISWGLMCWLLWVPGDALNHAVVVAPLIAVPISNAASANDWRHYLAGIVPVMLLASLRLLTDPNPANLGLLALLLGAFVYTFVLAAGAIRQGRSLLHASFANEDLTVDLCVARDEALEKRFEAEAANEAKSAFLANMSHELRTPLNAIIGFSEIIGQEAFGPIGVKRYREYAHDIQTSGNHLLNIIDDILDVAKIESHHMEVAPASFDMRKAVRESLRALTAFLAQKRQTLRLRIAADVSMFYADERAFKQILASLAGNAVKFTQEGGEIDISLRTLSDGTLELAVQDNGPGFDPALIERLFKPFNYSANRYSRVEGGTGLGLPLVRGLTELHSGTVEIRTAVGDGCRAVVHLPRQGQTHNLEAPARLSA